MLVLSSVCPQTHWVDRGEKIVKVDGLKSMVQHLPKSKAELLNCKFWGSRNVHDWGDEFLDVLKANRGAVDLERQLGRHRR